MDNTLELIERKMPAEDAMNYNTTYTFEASYFYYLGYNFTMEKLHPNSNYFRFLFYDIPKHIVDEYNAGEGIAEPKALYEAYYEIIGRLMALKKERNKHNGSGS